MKLKGVGRTFKIISYISIALLFGGFVFWTQMKGTGEINQSNVVGQSKPMTELKLFDGRNIMFNYPGTYMVREIENKGTDLELYQLDASTAYLKKVSVSVSLMPDGTLNSNSAYLLRKNRPDLYVKRELGPSPLSIEIWSKLDNKEQTVFITNNDRVAVFAFTQSNGRSEDLLSSEVDNLISTFKWK